MLLKRLMVLRAVAVLSAAQPLPSPPPQRVLWWNMSAAVGAEGMGFSEQVVAFALQGLFNRKFSRRTSTQQQLLFFDIGKMNYDWPGADAHWMKVLQSDGRATFTEIEPTLCALVNAATTTGGVFGGTARYDAEEAAARPPGLRRRFGDGVSTAVALTLAGQRALLPVDSLAAARHGCLRQLPTGADVRQLLRGRSRREAWDWAIRTLLPKSNRSIVYNLNRFRTAADPLGFQTDKQSPATASSLDYAITRNAFVIDLESHAAPGTDATHSTAPWNYDDELITRVFGQLDPLFDAYGWADDEFSWTNETTHGGGTVMCSFASPNLSFWAQLPLPLGAATDKGRRARRLPSGDRGLRLDRSKYYVTFETNEGDTPRILVSAMASSWADARRGSLPVAWAIDPLLAERFPALFDHFAATATANDSFVMGTAGAGYAFLDGMSRAQLRRYGERVGRLVAAYSGHGRAVVDTYGYANLTTHEAYAAAIRSGGGPAGQAPAAFVSQPQLTNGPKLYGYSPFNCTQDNQLLRDGIPLICSSGQPKLFYYSGSLSPMCPACDLAHRIEQAARKQPPPFFVLAYGGLQAFGGSDKPSPKSFFTLLHNALDLLGNDFVPIGSAEMARLAAQALVA
jgi:hypothetical protein